MTDAVTQLFNSFKEQPQCELSNMYLLTSPTVDGCPACKEAISHRGRYTNNNIRPLHNEYDSDEDDDSAGDDVPDAIKNYMCKMYNDKGDISVHHPLPNKTMKTHVNLVHRRISEEPLLILEKNIVDEKTNTLGNINKVLNDYALISQCSYALPHDYRSEMADLYKRSACVTVLKYFSENKVTYADLNADLIPRAFNKYNEIEYAYIRYAIQSIRSQTVGSFVESAYDDFMTRHEVSKFCDNHAIKSFEEISSLNCLHKIKNIVYTSNYNPSESKAEYYLMSPNKLIEYAKLVKPHNVNGNKTFINGTLNGILFSGYEYSADYAEAGETRYNVPY